MYKMVLKCLSEQKSFKFENALLKQKHITVDVAQVKLYQQKSWVGWIMCIMVYMFFGTE